jgi:lipoate-protein ligase B
MNCEIIDLGLLAYAEAYALQKKYVEDVGRGGDMRLILCEHPAVITMGRLAREINLLMPREEITGAGVAVIPIDRGGDVTLHGPGQLVVYPILRLEHWGRDLRFYLRKLEQVVIELLNQFDIVASRRPGQTGVWVGKEKIASIGIGVKKWITFHGAAVNVNTDLNLFSMINPCGLDARMTSMAKIKNSAASMRDVKAKWVDCFCSVFRMETINSGS